eukprot:TRINITY_DN6761_c0_g1_i5.p1 TRINITY_DN6761_c0_g1~~TRINITY_DN6761_c0_g1_i5.p1  ORF type:complete len:119 (-),score=6.84 TRINITY_DN6761_c0_g1_i5:48-404(-)
MAKPHMWTLIRIGTPMIYYELLPRKVQPPSRKPPRVDNDPATSLPSMFLVYDRDQKGLLIQSCRRRTVNMLCSDFNEELQMRKTHAACIIDDCTACHFELQTDPFLSVTAGLPMSMAA